MTQTPFKLRAEVTEESQFTAITTEIENKGIAVLFSFIEDETSSMEANITDNYVETNHAVQDHIAIKPRIYRLRGCVGEIVYKGSSEWLEALTGKINSNPVLSKTMEAMKPIGAISGIVSNATQTAINVVNQLESSYKRYKKLVEDNFISSKQQKLLNKKQEAVVADLNRILELRVPVNLKGLKYETTLDKGNNFKRVYYLQSVSAHQGNNSYITDIEVTIKEFKIATTKVVSLDKKYGVPTPSAIMKQAEVEQGPAKNQEIPKNTENTIKDTVKNALKDHPFLYKITSSTYNALKNDFNKPNCVLNPANYRR